MDKKEFSTWIGKVAKILSDLYGWRLGDLPDYRWIKLHEQGVSPKKGVEIFVKDWCEQTRITNFFGEEWWKGHIIRVSSTGATTSK